ncbi:hypothetical protein [Desulfospira joergensenii]|uniref:hypothetical protein n=1 Tax=Desulfospira joergensenii TaxID=53329 RepID=UPI0003B44542|nr:hypothetical protein [Desulfospira joergensenii]
MNAEKGKKLYTALAVLVVGLVVACLIVPGENLEAKAIQQTENQIQTEGQNQNGETVVKLNLLNQIKKKITADTGSMLTELSPEAVKIGLAEVQLYGRVKHEPLADQSTRMFIEWHSIGIPAGNNETLTDNLDNPLSSQFRTTDLQVEPGTVVTATGDLQGLIDKFLELKEKTKKESPKHILEEKEEEEEENGLSSTGDSGGYSSGSGGDYGSSLSSPDDFSTNLITTTWEDCSPRVSQEDGRVYRQARPVGTDETGKAVETGACEDQGGYVEIQKEYGEPCTIIYDYENKKAYEQYREFAEVDGEFISVTNCSNDFQKSYDIYGITDGCGIRHDFVAGKSIIQEKLFYMDNAGEETQITACIDSDKAYAHFLTDATCSPYIDKVNNTATLYNRTAYKLDDGTIEYASECRAVDGGVKDLYEAYCDQKYEHDFVSGQSYYRTKDYYLDDNNQPVYLTECTRSTVTSFPHIYNTESCGVENDDSTLSTTTMSRTIIETPDDGTMELAPCQARGAAVPYLYMSTETRTKVIKSTQNWTVPVGVKSVTVFLIAGGGRGGNSHKKGYGNGGLDGGTADGEPGWCCGGGGGGGAGQQVTKTVTVTPGEKIAVTIGNSNQNSYFGSYVTADYTKGAKGGNGYGFKYSVSNGGKGANGYGSAALAKAGANYTDNYQPIAVPMGGAGGLGYGAGGGGACGGAVNKSGGAGAPGYCKITYNVNQYRRGDGTIYWGQP